MKKLFILITVSLTLCIQPGFSQDECDAEKLHQHLMQHDEAYRSAWEVASSTQRTNVDSGQVFTIPLVVHVVHRGENEGVGSNIPDARIIAAINKMNNNYKYARGNDIGIQFCFATIDPDGNPTSGIVRVDGSTVPDYIDLGLESSQGPGADETAVKDLSRWPNTEYYNIWVVHKIVGGVAGFAYYPTTYINDGTAIEAGSMTAQSTTLTHELGHAFNLRHTFQGDNDGNSCPVNNDCTIDGDKICDTPPHKRLDCLLLFGNPCTSNDAGFINSTDNFMSYCLFRNRFTPEQRIWARNAALAYPRDLLAQSGGCGSPFDLDGDMVEITYPLTTTHNDYCPDGMIGRFVLANAGNADITSFGVNYTFDGPLRPTGYFTNLAPGESAEFELPAEILNTSIDFHSLQVVIASINEGVDENPMNDTAYIVYDINDSCTVTGIADHILGEMSIYPNPVSGNLIHIEIKTLTFGPLELTIHDAIGRILSEEELNSYRVAMDIAGISPGAYFLTLKAGDGSIGSIPFVRF
ncbi:MAG: T9SS type A sorting domain-containing protein [Bacteroidetes bacterium]|nr:T9SS type A sorting domain-containing protein [Bacteroidota bacterium]